MKSIALLAGTFLAISTFAVQAQTQVGSAAALQTAIDNGDTNIVLTNGFAVTTPINIGTTSSPTITINGAGFTLTGTSEIFFVQSGNVTISNATLSGTAIGGNGGVGQNTGGGALGAGGAIFVGSTATVQAANVNFTNNSATGGAGLPSTGGGSGGGGGINGGTGGFSNSGGAGGGGGGGNGGSGGSGLFAGASGGSGGGGGLNSAGSDVSGVDGGNGGGANGGAGGIAGGTSNGANGGNNGGGGGSSADNPANGGNGGANGGGGGSFFGTAGNGGAYGGGGGSSVGQGGNGGFGGGGGAGDGTAGNGGFGGGGGGSPGGGGTGGTGAGNGNLTDGGGGAALGGAVFVQSGGSFTITGNQTFSGNTLTAGTGANAGATAGGDIFAMTGATTTFAPGAGDTQTFNETIADDSSPSLPGGGSFQPGSANGAAITLGTAGSAGGTVVFNQQDTFSGGLTITNGVTVQAGNALALGTGGVTLQSGTVQMGNGVHALTVAAYTQQAGGTLQLAVSGSGQAATADSITVVDSNGTHLGGRLSLNLRGFTVPSGLQGQTFAFTLLNTNGYTGQFATLTATGLASGLTLSLDYAATDVILDITQSQAVLGFSFAGLTTNQQGVLAPINRAAANGSANPAFVKITTALRPLAGTPGGLGSALDQLSPLQFGHFASTTAANNASFATEQRDNYLAGQRVGPNGTFLGGNGSIDSSGLTLNDPSYDPSLAMIHSRMLAWNAGPSKALSDLPQAVLGGTDMKDIKPLPPTNPWNVFVEGNVILAQGFSQQDVSHFDDNTESVNLGADYRFTPNFLVGVVAGYAHTDATLDNNGSSATIDSYSPGFYASYADRGWYGNLSGSYIHNAYTQSRVISFLGQTADSAPEGNQGVANLDGGYDFHFGALTVGPLAGVQYTHLTVDGYHENGSAADLNVDSQDADSLRSRLGGRLSYDFRHCGVKLTPHLDASWQHEFLDQARGITSQFGFGGGAFSVRTPNASRDSALASAGLDADINRSVSVFGDYVIQAGQDNYFGQSVQAGVKIGF